MRFLSAGFTRFCVGEGMDFTQSMCTCSHNLTETCLVLGACHETWPEPPGTSSTMVLIASCSLDCKRHKFLGDWACAQLHALTIRETGKSWFCGRLVMCKQGSKRTIAAAEKASGDRAGRKRAMARAGGWLLAKGAIMAMGDWLL